MQCNDVVEGSYEGGLKLWECSVDLVHYMEHVDVDWAGLKTIEVSNHRDDSSRCSFAFPDCLISC